MDTVQSTAFDQYLGFPMHIPGMHIKVISKHLKKSNAACFYTPIVLKLLIIVQM